MNTSFLNLHSSIRLTVERNINLRAHLVLLAYRCVPVKELDVGVLSRHWIGRASEGTERKSIFQRRENKWPAIQVHLRLRLGREEKERATGRSCKLKKHASKKPGYLLVFYEKFWPPSRRVALRLPRLPKWTVRDAHYWNCFTRRFWSTYICYCCGPSLSELPTGNMSKIWLSSIPRSALIKQ